MERAFAGGIIGQVQGDGASADEVDLAQRLFAAWQSGTPKSRLERETWGDGGAHGRRFDRFIFSTLGIKTTERSKQALRIELLERQVRGLGEFPAGHEPREWERQVQHARDATLSAVRVWNDPTANFRTGQFSLSIVTAWNSLAIAQLMKTAAEWRDLSVSGADYARPTSELVADAFPGIDRHGLRQNVQYWMDLRNAVAHHCLPALDVLVIPEAQAGLLNIEHALVELFGPEYALGERMSVPLQLSGFRNPDMLKSLRTLQSHLPLDVQAILSRAENASPELIADPTYQLGVGLAQLGNIAGPPFPPHSGRFDRRRTPPRGRPRATRAPEAPGARNVPGSRGIRTGLAGGRAVRGLFFSPIRSLVCPGDIRHPGGAR